MKRVFNATAKSTSMGECNTILSAYSVAFTYRHVHVSTHVNLDRLTYGLRRLAMVLWVNFRCAKTILLFDSVSN